MSELRRTDSNLGTPDYPTRSISEKEHWMSDGGEPLVPTPEELAVLSPFERFAFRVTHRMNRGGWKRFWTWCQRVFGAAWIHISTDNLMRVYGLESIDAVDHDRPILLVANHPTLSDSSPHSCD